MELDLSLCNPQAPAPPYPTGNLILGLCFSMESAMESKHQQLHKHNDPGDLPLQLGLQSTGQPKRMPSPGSGEDSAGSRGSEDEEKDLSSLSRKKMRLSKEQFVYLEESFNEHQTLNPKQKVGLAEQLGLRPRQVEVWFQNRRARTKLKQTEVDCSYLKHCYDTLTADNRRLQKELADLRALKAAQPFNIQLPATTLSLCPSCKRITPNAGGGGDHGRTNSFGALLDKGGFFPFAGPPSHKPSAA